MILEGATLSQQNGKVWLVGDINCIIFLRAEGGVLFPAPHFAAHRLRLW